MKPDMRPADLNAEFSIGGSKNILGFSGIISYFEYNRISIKNLQNLIPIPKSVVAFEEKYTKLTKQVRVLSFGGRHLVRKFQKTLTSNNISKGNKHQAALSGALITLRIQYDYT